MSEQLAWLPWHSLWMFMLLRRWILNTLEFGFESYTFMLSRGWTSATQSAQNLRLPCILRHITMIKCHVRKDLFLVDIVSFEFEKVSNNRQHTLFPHQLTVFIACLIAVISTLGHSVCVSKFLMWLVIKQNWFASCYCCHSCCFTVTWVPVCLWYLLSLGVMLVTRMRGNNSSMVILLYLVESLKLHRNMILINCTAISTLSVSVGDWKSCCAMCCCVFTTWQGSLFGFPLYLILIPHLQTTHWSEGLITRMVTYTTCFDVVFPTLILILTAIPSISSIVPVMKMMMSWKFHMVSLWWSPKNPAYVEWYYQEWKTELRKVPRTKSEFSQVELSHNMQWKRGLYVCMLLSMNVRASIEGMLWHLQPPAITLHTVAFSQFLCIQPSATLLILSRRDWKCAPLSLFLWLH